MSYCRWSSDGFRCDIYAYASCEGGVTVHVARRRQRGWYNVPHRIQAWAFMRMVRDYQEDEWPSRVLMFLHLSMSRLSHLAFTLGVPGWMTHYEIPLEIPEDRYGLSYGEAAAWLVELRSQGFLVPQYAIDGLREEQEAEAVA